VSMHHVRCPRTTSLLASASGSTEMATSARMAISPTPRGTGVVRSVCIAHASARAETRAGMVAHSLDAQFSVCSLVGVGLFSARASSAMNSCPRPPSLWVSVHAASTDPVRWRCINPTRLMTPSLTQARLARSRRSLCLRPVALPLPPSPPPVRHWYRVNIPQWTSGLLRRGKLKRAVTRAALERERE